MLPDLTNLDRAVVGFTLTFFRVAGLMLFAPLFGSARVSQRVKLLVALVMTLPIYTAVQVHVSMPATIAQLALGLVGEIAFGFVMGMVVSLTFIAAQWAGEMVGQQIGLSISQVLDPQFGGGGSLIAELYFMLTTAVFLILGGHRTMVAGVYDSLQTFPPLTVVFNEDLMEVVLHFLTSATTLALKLAAPMFVTMIVVDVSLGCISKTMPQLNVMSAGMAVRGVLGILVLGMGVGMAAHVIGGNLDASLDGFTSLFGGH